MLKTILQRVRGFWVVGGNCGSEITIGQLVYSYSVKFLCTIMHTINTHVVQLV